MEIMRELPKRYQHPYEFNSEFDKPVAYFCMEYAIDQALKIYSGGLGYLAGSHMRSAFDLKQNLIGIGILWKYGYYDQFKQADRKMGIMFQEKFYDFLEETDIKFTINISGHSVWVKAYYLAPEIFGTVPMFFLSTDVEENDYLARSTTFKLYDSNPKAKIAQSMVLGIGGAQLLEELNYNPDVYHFNEAHALSAVFRLKRKYDNLDELKNKVVFTTHTPEEAGNEKHNINELSSMGFFDGYSIEEARQLTGCTGDTFDHSLAMLRLSRNANGVSKLHGVVSRNIWGKYDGIAPITHVTNAQNRKYWADKALYKACEKNDLDKLQRRKIKLKKELFKEVADQTGKLFDTDVLTIVWARRFAEYKRPDLITRDVQAFKDLLNDKDKPVQIIFAGKPYPMDLNAIGTFDKLTELSFTESNMAVLTGYELSLSKLLKAGADIWLNTPRVTREASGTSGMTAAMNGAINLSTNDGWIREFDDMYKDVSFVLPIVDFTLPHHEQDQKDLDNLYESLTNEILPLFYDDSENWYKKVCNSMTKVVPYFDSDRFATEYYTKLYNS